MKIYKWYLLQIVYKKNHTNYYVGLFIFLRRLPIKNSIMVKEMILNEKMSISYQKIFGIKQFLIFLLMWSKLLNHINS